MTTKAAGLNLQAAWDEASKEEGLSEPESAEADTTVTDTQTDAQEEQPAVESDEETGLFSDLVDEEPSGEQPQIGDSTMVEFGDGEISIGELKNGYMRQEDYTKKTQETSEQRKEAEQALTLYRALQENPVQTVQKLWESTRQGKLPVSDQTPLAQGKVSHDQDIDAIVQAKLEEALASDPRMKALEEQRAMDEVNAIFADIEADYEVALTDADKEFILNEAVKANTSDIEAIFAKNYHKKQNLERQRENAASNSTSTGYGGTHVVAPKAPEKYSSWRDAMNETLAAEGMSGSDLDAAISNL